jgi:hypothetical protein
VGGAAGWGGVPPGGGPGSGGVSIGVGSNSGGVPLSLGKGVSVGTGSPSSKVESNAHSTSTIKFLIRCRLVLNRRNPKTAQRK